MRLDSIVDDIDRELPEVSWTGQFGSLVMMVGLPGVGKSSVVNCLEPLLPFVRVTTDEVRKKIRQSPLYTAPEMMLVYEVCYELIERRLQRGQRVVFDGSNYLAARREYLKELARRCGAPTAVCVVQASKETIRERLLHRHNTNRETGDNSDADWAVYNWMVEAQEPVVGEHLILDTTTTSPEILAQKLFSYWLEIEKTAASDPDLQSLSWAGKLGRFNGTRR